MKKLCIALLCLALTVSLVGTALAEDCKHASRHLVTVVNYDYPIYSRENLAEPAVYHQVTYEAWQYWECDACGERFSGRPLPEADEVKLEEHAFENGVCACGYEAQAIAESVAANDVGRETVKVNARPVNDRLHIWDVLDDETGKKIGTTIAQHDYENGVCDACGHVNTCSHPASQQITGSDYSSQGEMVSSMTITSGYHEYTVDRAGKELRCGVCGEYLPEQTFGQTTIQERHKFEDGECYVCGYNNPCNHSRTRDESHPESMQGRRVRNIGDASVHQLWGDWTEENTYCDICGEWLSSREFGDTATATEPHDFDSNGVCRICGYPVSPVTAVAPATTPTPAPTATTTTTTTTTTAGYVPVSDNIPVHGVKASDGLTAVAAMQAVGNSLAGENASVSVPSFERILSSDELRRYNALSVEDRLLVALSVLGCGNSASLSADAQTLAQDIAARLNNMGATYLQDAMNVAVTRTIVTVNGHARDAVRLEVVVEQGGSRTRERHTFYDENGQWMLYGIERWQ